MYGFVCGQYAIHDNKELFLQNVLTYFIAIQAVNCLATWHKGRTIVFQQLQCYILFSNLRQLL